jgi:CheY-like chemotaxis protein
MTDDAALQVLLVEDEPINRKLVTAMFARILDPRLRSAELIEVDTLAAARRVLADQPVDIVLLDVQLPDGNGLQLAIELSYLPPDQRRPVVIAVTAGALAQQHDAALAADCHAVLIKPFTIDQLQATIAPHLDRLAPASTDRRD